MNFINVFAKMVELFLIIIVGYGACKAKIFDKEARVRGTKLVLNVTLPATILASVMTQDNLPGVMQILQLLLVAVLSYVILFASAFIVPRLIGVPKSQIGIYQFMLAFGNVGFIGYPVTQAIFGNQAVFYTSVFNLPFNLLVYSVGVMFIQTSSATTGKETQGKALKQTSGKKTAITVKTFLSPCMVASVISIVMALCHWKGPVLIGDTCNMIGAITTPMALLIIGSSLADMPFQEMFGNARIYIFSIFRLILVPLLIYLIFKLFVKDMLLLGVCVIIAAMPVATNGTMLCLSYQGDEKLMAQGTFLTTLLSVITIPVMAMLFI